LVLTVWLEGRGTVTVSGGSPGSVASGRVVRARGRRIALLLVAAIFVALTVVGALGTVRYVSTFWLYRGFPPPSLPHSVVVRGPGGPRQVPVVAPAVQNITVPSPALGSYADPVTVVLPPGYASHPGRRYPVLYLLHGFPGLPAQYLNVGQVSAAEAALVAAGRMKPMILVLPTGTRSSLGMGNTEWANGVRGGSGWETFVAHDLVNAIDARYRTIRSGAARGIGGLSAGGYGALNIGLHHPGQFGLLESWSGYVRADRIPAIFGRSTTVRSYNSPSTWIAAVAPQVRADHTYIWFYSGASDSLAPQNRAFAAQLATLGVAHHFFLAPGRHNWQLWRGFMPQALITASDHLTHG
jgi:enterochelin esterase-like enzyme